MKSSSNGNIAGKHRPNVISDKQQIRCLINPVRQNVFDAIKGLKSASATQIGKQLGSPADVVNYHLRKLGDVGLITQFDIRGKGRNAERVFKITNPKAKVLFDPNDPDNVELLNKAVQSLLALSQKDFSKAFTPEKAVTTGANRNLRASRITAWLTKHEWEKVNRLIEELSETLALGAVDPSGDAELYAVTIVTAPIAVQPTKRRRQA